MVQQAKPLDERFWSKVQKTDSCWLWCGTIVPTTGYGAMRVGSRIDGSRKQESAHVLAFVIFHGRRPNGYVLHSCDNRRCVNPAHLREGTHLENMREKYEKGRCYRGARHHHAKLTEEQVREIKKSFGLTSKKVLAERFGVAPHTIYKIARGLAWAHVEV